jgi:hypothetical protein
MYLHVYEDGARAKLKRSLKIPSKRKPKSNQTTTKTKGYNKLSTMDSIGRGFQGQTITLGDGKGEIQLTDRQLQLIEARRMAKLHAGTIQISQKNGSQHPGATGRDPTPRMNTKDQNKWNDDQTMPSTWSESTSNASSAVSKASSTAASSIVSAAMSRAASSRRHSTAMSSSSSSYSRVKVNPVKQFYGQGVRGESKKLYDDSGASYVASKSEASSLLTSNQSHKQQQVPAVMPHRVDRVPRQKISEMATSAPADVKAPQPQQPTLGNADQQKAFLRKMMQSYSSKPQKEKNGEAVSEASSVSQSKKKSWMNRKSKAASFASSRTSSASHDRAIMRKVLQRAKNKKNLLANPRKQKLIKQNSSRMKKLLSPKKDLAKISSPKSDTSSNAGSDTSSKSFSFGKFSSKKKVSRSPKFSSRKAKTRMYSKDMSVIPSQIQEHPGDDLHEAISTDPTASVTEPSTNASTGAGISASIRKLYDDSGASVVLSETTSSASSMIKRQTTDVSDKSIKPHVIDIERQATDVSALTRKHSHEVVDSGAISRTPSQEEAQLEISESKSSNIESIPEMTNDGEIEIRLSLSSLSQKFRGAEGGCTIPSSETAKSAVFSSKHGETVYDDTEFDEYPEMYNPEPEGYRDFLQTLKAEVSGTHSNLWESFHSLFRGPQSFTRPLDYGTVSSKFDDKTKTTVANMSTYLKTKYGAASEAGTQLANDKAVKAGNSSNSQNKWKRPNQLKSRPKSRHSYAGFGSAPTFDSIEEPPTDMVSNFNDFLAQNVQKSLGKKAAKALMLVEDSESEVSSFAATSYVESEYLSEASNAARKDISSHSAISKAPESTKSTSAPKDPESAKSATSKPNFKISKSKIPLAEPAKSETSSAPSWTGLKLRPVSVLTDAPGKKTTDKLRHVEQKAVSEVSSSASTIPTSWAKVKLRKVEKKGETTERKNVEPITKTNETTESDSIHHFVVRKQPKSLTVQKPESDKALEKTKTQEAGNPQNNVIATAEKKEASITESHSEEWDLKAISASVSTDSTTDGTVVVPLAAGPESKTFFGLKVVIGKKGIMKIDFPPNLSQATVIWRLDLDELKSAMLDMSAFKVKLLQTNGDHKDLSFENSENCMKFANAFHEAANDGEDDFDDNIHQDSSDGSVYVEQLSQEEQQVLQEFRKKKRLSKDPSEKVVAAPKAAPKIEAASMSLFDQLQAKKFRPQTMQDGKATTVMSTSSLTTEEKKVVDSYKKMLMLRIPEEAVRHKMEKENVDVKLMSIVLGEKESSVAESAPVAASNGLSIAEEAAAAPYKRMLKLSIPAEGVRHKMEKDGVDVKIILAVLGGGDSATAPKPSQPSGNLSAAEEKSAASYKKMLKLMMPKEAVEHKMKLDGVAPKIMASVLGVSADSFGGGAKNKTTLTDEEESIASSFRKMLALKISKESIRQKMQTDCISEKIMVSVLGEAFMKGSNRNKAKPAPRAKGGFHWSPLTSEDKLRTSVWNKSTLAEYAELDVDSDITKHLELFQKKVDEKDASKAVIKKADGTEAKVMAKLIDLGRANNLAITLKAFNDIPQKELAQIIEFVDPYGKIKGDRALFMRDLLPAPAEVKVVQKYIGDDDRLVPAEIWFKQIVNIKRIHEKIQVMRTIETFKLEVLALIDSFQMIIKVCNQIMKSEKLPDLLEMVRQIGNRMNEGRGEEAAGFKLDFLSRLSQTKGSDKKTTALDLVVMIFLTRNQRAALSLTADFPLCREASKLKISDLSSDVRRLGSALQKCKKEKDLLRNDGNIPKWGKTAVADSKKEGGPQNKEWFANRSTFLSSVIGASNGGVPKPEEKLAPMIKSPRASDVNRTILDDSGDRVYSLKHSVEKIEDFLEQGNDSFKQLKAVNEEAVKTCKELSDFFCEKGAEKATSNLFEILAEFAANLDRAVKKQDEQEKRREARLKSSSLRKSQVAHSATSSMKKGPAKSPTNSTVSTASTVSAASDDSIGGKSLVFMVNQMLKKAGDKMKEDFANGITYEEPIDNNLKEIYGLENTRVGAKSIVGKIASRRETSERVAQTGLSDLVKRIEDRSKRSKAEKFVGRPPVSANQDIVSKDSTTIERAPSKDSRNDETSLRPRRSSVSDRWTRRVEEDQVSDSGQSATLSSYSSFSEDGKLQEIRRQRIINRWASNDGLVEVASKDFEEGSDVSFSNSVVNKTRQRYLDRWAARPKDEEVVSDL